MPCIDNCGTQSCQSASSKQLEEQDNDVQDNDVHNECSPLCNCLCCTSIVSISDNYSLQFSFKTTNIEISPSKNLIPFSLKPTSPPPKA